MCRLEAVAVWTEDPQVVESVVVLIAVDVIELYRNATVRRSFCPATQLTSLLLETRCEQSLLETMTAGRSTGNENELERNRQHFET